MRRGLALLLFGLLATTAWAGCNNDEDEDSSSSEEDEQADASFLGQRIGDSAFRLERLEARLNAIKARLDDDDLVDHSLDVISKVESLEGGICPEDEFRCGSNTMCVSTLLACDGTSDCPNDDDESEERCKNKALAGESFTGRISWDGCKARADSDMTIAIIGRKDYDYFPSRTWITARTTFDYGNEAHTFDSTGVVNYGTNGLSLTATGEHVNADCSFVTNDVIDCEITNNSGAKCADVRLSRQ